MGAVEVGVIDDTDRVVINETGNDKGMWRAPATLIYICILILILLSSRIVFKVAVSWDSV